MRTVHGVGYALEPGAGATHDHRAALDQVTSLKVKLGLLVAASVTVAAVVASLGGAGGVPVWLSIPVTIALALAVTQLLAVGMTSPLRADDRRPRGRMARGDYAVRVTDTSSDEVGELARAFNTHGRATWPPSTGSAASWSPTSATSCARRSPRSCAVLENLVDGVAARDPAVAAAALDQAERLEPPGRGPARPRPRRRRQGAADAPSPSRSASCSRAPSPRPGSRGRDVGYDVRVEPADLVVQADPARLHQLVANLLDNASRHSPSGGTVPITADAARRTWRLEVADEGPGIAAADRERVFERFGTLAATDGGGGTGLGLAIARWVTDLHGGTIHFVDPERRQHRRPGAGRPPARADRPTGPPPGGDHADRHPVRADADPARTTGPVPVPHRRCSTAIFGDFWPERGVPARLPLLLGCPRGRPARRDRPAVPRPRARHVPGAARGRRCRAGGQRDAATPSPSPAPGSACCWPRPPCSGTRSGSSSLCLLAGAAVCLCGRHRSRTLSGFVLSGLAWPLAGLRGLPWLGRTARPSTGLGHGAAVLRTVVLVGARRCSSSALLFASADALFAEWVVALLPDLALDTFVLRAVHHGRGRRRRCWRRRTSPSTRRRSTRPAPDAAGRRTASSGWRRCCVVDAVFAVFLVAQAAVIFGGHDYVERTTGLTYAEYVHQGFGQLTVATALTLLVVWAAARKAPARHAGRPRLAAGVARPALPADPGRRRAPRCYRMHVYQEAYGFTQLRLLVDVFEGWLGLLVVGVLAAGVAPARRAGCRGSPCSAGSLALLGLAAINPDAWIAQRNLDRYDETGKIDWTYLQGLSDDAVPALVDLPPAERDCALLGRDHVDDDWLEWNLGRARAGHALESTSRGTHDKSVSCEDSRD